MMRGLSATKPLKVDGRWNGSGVLLFPEEPSELAARLRDLLFAWHSPSWYGADVELLDTEEGPRQQRTLLVPALIALDYLADRSRFACCPSSGATACSVSCGQPGLSARR